MLLVLCDGGVGLARDCNIRKAFLGYVGQQEDTGVNRRSLVVSSTMALTTVNGEDSKITQKCMSGSKHYPRYVFDEQIT